MTAPLCVTIRRDRLLPFAQAIAVSGGAEVLISVSDYGFFAHHYSPDHVYMVEAWMEPGHVGCDGMIPTRSFLVDVNTAIDLLQRFDSGETLSVRVGGETKPRLSMRGILSDGSAATLAMRVAPPSGNGPRRIDYNPTGRAYVQGRQIIASAKTIAEYSPVVTVRLDGQKLKLDGHSDPADGMTDTSASSELIASGALGSFKGRYPADVVFRCLAGLGGDVVMVEGSTDAPLRISTDAIFGDLAYTVAPNIEDVP